MVSPRRGEGTPPYRCFVGLQHIIKCSVRNGLDRSLQIVFQLVPISIKPTSKRRTTRWFCVIRLYLSFVFYYTKGNTAQFPPNGSSTAPAAAAPRSPYRHLELCGIALGCILLLVTPCAGSGHRSPQCPHPGNRCGCRSDPPGQCPQWQRSAAWRRTVALPKHRAAPRIAGTHRNPPWC